MRELALIACLALAGCDTLAEFTTKSSVVGSYVEPAVTGAEAETVANDMARFLADQFPYAKTTIRLDPLKTQFRGLLIDELARRGFGIVESPVPGSVLVRYAVTYLPGGVVARMRFNGKEASRFYAITGKGLSLRNNYAVRGVSK